jgi:hypothetical protein
MGTPSISSTSRKAIRTAMRQRLVAKGGKTRLLLLAEALARVDAASIEGVRPDDVSLRSIPEHSVAEAIGVMASGGIYQAIQDAEDAQTKKRYRKVADVLADTCAAASCSVQTVCRTKDGRFASTACGLATPVRSKLASGASVWLGAPARIAVESASGVSTLDARYVLVPIDAMIPSHQPMMGFEPAPGYPAELQERDYQGS